MSCVAKPSLVVALALMLVPYSYAVEWVPADTLQQLQSLLQLGASDPKGTVAASRIGAQATGTQSPKTIYANEWVPAETLQQLQILFQSGAPNPIAAPTSGAKATGTQPLKMTPSRGISLDDQRGNDWWSEQPVMMTGTVAQPLKTTPSRGLAGR